MEQPKELPLDEQVRRIRKDVGALVDKLELDPKETIMLLMQRELVFLNTELRRIHEMTDLMLADTHEILKLMGKKAKKAKGRKR